MSLGVGRPALFCVAMVAYFAALLAADGAVGHQGQLGLAAVTAIMLVAVLTRVSAELRAQALVVVGVATCFEILGSVIWGVYTYRLENLPLFVPPSHGLVYLTGLALSQTALVRRLGRGFVALVVLAAGAWAIAGLSVLPRTDVVGAFGMGVFLVFLLRSRAPLLLGGVFFAVAALELYGTAIGTWTWAPVVPGLGLPNGNPPSGAVSGYVLFDLAAMAAAPHLLRRARTLRRKGANMNLRPSKARLALLTAVVGAAVLAAVPNGAIAATSQDRQLAALQRQVTAMNRQMTAMRRQVTTLQRQVRTLNQNLLIVRQQQLIGFVGLTCQTALVADLFLGTWGVIDQIAQATQARTYFGQQQPLSEFGHCAALRQPNVPRPAVAVPPTITVLNPMLAWLRVGN